jgi:hypothetical protein
MNIFKLRKYLRLNPTGKTGKKGTYSLRLTIGTDPALTPIRKEFGLGTSDEEEALMRAALIVRVVYELGCKFSNRIKLDDVKLGELLDSLQPPQKKSSARTSELPLFEFLPPEKRKDEEP